MSEIFATLIFFGLIYLLFKMFGRYIWPAVLFGIIGAIVGAFFGKEGTWTYYALGGAAIGLVICLIVDFSNAWRTILGATIGGLIGVGIAYFVGQNMWSSVIFLACIIVGGAVTSSAAFEDLFSDESNVTVVKPSNSGNKSNHSYVDAKGFWHDSYADHICNECQYFNKSTSMCEDDHRYVGWSEKACDNYH